MITKGFCKKPWMSHSFIPLNSDVVKRQNIINQSKTSLPKIKIKKMNINFYQNKTTKFAHA